ncbi:MAG: bifunctional hydroxymethylpyrimidine kinase/phosphomethylpyrimidine kinase, partial [Nitrosopumilaceae archaeon]
MNISPVSPSTIKNQLDVITSDFKIDAIKIGMVYNSDIIKIIYNCLKKLSLPIVLDPVIKSTTGGMLIQKTAVSDFKKYLIPLATVITPNKFEAEFISKSKINSRKSLINSGKIIQKLGAKNIVITGLTFEKNKIIDFVMTKKDQNFIEGVKLDSKNHGSGGNYSAAMIFSLVRGKSVLESARFARKYSFESIKGAKKRGKGITITDKKSSKEQIQLQNAITQFTQIKNISQNIPECQTNFVFSKKSPKSIKDVLGISGRIVKTGNTAVKAGELEYGGSKHVATAVISMNKKLKKIRSAINLKFSEDTIVK